MGNPRELKAKRGNPGVGGSVSVSCVDALFPSAFRVVAQRRLLTIIDIICAPAGLL